MKNSNNFFWTIKFRYIFLAMIVIVACLAINLLDKNFFKNLTSSIRNTLQSTKPTEELFDDTGGVKLVSVLFGENSCIVSTMPLDYDLKLSQYSKLENNNGIILVKQASGVLYAPTDGEIKIKRLENGLNELTIKHSSNFATVFTGDFNVGVKEGQFVEKNYPIALLVGDLEFYLKLNDDIIESFDFNEESLWQN